MIKERYSYQSDVETVWSAKKKAREWKVRLNEEVRNNKNAIFVTLTFSNEAIKELDDAVNKLEEKLNTKSKGYYRDNAIAKLGVRRFLERWRKENKKRD